MNGKLICNQEITDIITTIDTGNWPSGTYIWKVVSDSKVAETGENCEGMTARNDDHTP